MNLRDGGSLVCFWKSQADDGRVFGIGAEGKSYRQKADGGSATKTEMDEARGLAGKRWVE